MSETLEYKVYRLHDKGASHHAALMYVGLKERKTLNEANFATLAKDLGMKSRVSAVHPIMGLSYNFPIVCSTLDGLGFLMFCPVGSQELGSRHFEPKDATLVGELEGRILAAQLLGTDFVIFDPTPERLPPSPGSHAVLLTPKDME